MLGFEEEDALRWTGYYIYVVVVFQDTVCAVYKVAQLVGKDNKRETKTP